MYGDNPESFTMVLLTTKLYYSPESSTESQFQGHSNRTRGLFVSLSARDLKGIDWFL